jgi:hypothetical protein
VCESGLFEHLDFNRASASGRPLRSPACKCSVSFSDGRFKELIHETVQQRSGIGDQDRLALLNRQALPNTLLTKSHRITQMSNW